MSERRRVLVSAYACEPGRGSEPGLGWTAARELAEAHDVWVITLPEHRPAIEAALAREPVSLHPVYYELPGWMSAMSRGPGGIHRHYALWQRGILRLARRLHARHDFHFVHHVTLAKCWTPSFLPRLGIPFVWGPLGGGDSAPIGFLDRLSWRIRVREAARNAARWLAAFSPALRRTARRSAVALGTTPDTVRYLERLGARDVRAMVQTGLTARELQDLSAFPFPGEAGTPRFATAGILVPRKGVHLAIEAFARAALPDAELEIFGDGPEMSHLRALVHRLEVSDRVNMRGWVPREELHARLSTATALLHPALHDSSPWTCAEALALGVPIIYLGLTGPAEMIPPGGGIRVDARGSEAAVEGLAIAIRRLGRDPSLRREMGLAARRHAQRSAWSAKVNRISLIYEEILAAGKGRS